MASSGAGKIAPPPKAKPQLGVRKLGTAGGCTSGTVGALAPDESRAFLQGDVVPAAQLDRGRDVLLLRGYKPVPASAPAAAMPASVSPPAPAGAAPVAPPPVAPVPAPSTEPAR